MIIQRDKWASAKIYLIVSLDGDTFKTFQN